MSLEELKTILIDLSSMTALMAKELISKTERRSDLYIRMSPDQLTFADDGTISGWSWKTEYINKYFDWDIIQNTVDNIIASPEFKRVIKNIIVLYQLDEEQSNSILKKFCGRIARSVIEEENLEEIMKDSIELLVNDLDGGKVNWYMKIRLNGIVLQTESIEIDKNILLRKVKAEDLIFEYHPESPHNYDRRLNAPALIAEINIWERYPNEAQNYVERLMSILRLYKVGAIAYESYTMKAHSITQFGGGTISHMQFRSQSPKCFLSANDEDPLKKLYAALKDSMPNEMLYGRLKGPLSIAFRRYSESLLDSVPDEAKLTTAVMGLEALLLEDTSELSHRLALRTAKFLSYLGDDPKSVYKNVIRAYGIRSKFVHGTTLNAKEYQAISELLNEIWEILRKLVLYFFLSNWFDEGQKREIIGRIDNSLIDEKDSENLKETINSTIIFHSAAFSLNKSSV